MPVRKEVSAAAIMIEPMRARFSGLAVRQMARAAPARPNIFTRKPPPKIPDSGCPRKKQVRMPLQSSQPPTFTWKKNGAFQMWCRPNGRSARSTMPYTNTATGALALMTLFAVFSMKLPTGGQMKDSTSPSAIAANAVTIGTNLFPAKNPR